jgi:hypothetical protein
VAARSWGSVKNVEEAKFLIDRMVMVRWQDMNRLKRHLPDAEQSVAIRYFAHTLLKKRQDPIAASILIESVLVWMLHHLKEDLVTVFLAEILAHDRYPTMCSTLIPLLTDLTVSDQEHESMIFSLGVLIGCELGVGLVKKMDPQDPVHVAALHEISSQLLVVGNRADLGVRLGLLHYFGALYQVSHSQSHLNHLLRRMGRTVLESLFSLLFQKKTESVALQYLLKHLPYVFSADPYVQVMVHDIFRVYLLRNPDRFLLFIKVFVKEFMETMEDQPETAKALLQHVGALFALCAEVRNKGLAREFAVLLEEFREVPGFATSIRSLLQEPEVRGPYREMCECLANPIEKKVSPGSRYFHSHKRGRKPTFSRMKKIHDVGQAAFLSGFCTMKVL